MAELFNALDTLATRWLVGGSSALPLPAAWHAPLGELPPQEQALAALALYGQARQFLSSPALPAGSRPGQPLPALPLPTLPDALRSRFRRLQATPSASQLLPFTLQLMASRGWMAHPYDFMPSSTGAELPSAYAALQLWSADTAVVAETVTAENWDEFTPALRRSLLLSQWKSDPEATRALFQARFAGEPAEQRVALLEMLGLRLSKDDIVFLESLSTDRSDKVRNAARVLLARLGDKAPLEAQQLAELREDFEVSRSGLLRRTTRVAMAVKKNGAQRASRRARLEACSWNQLCSVFEMDSTTLIESFRFDDRLDEALFVDCIVRTGTDADVLQMSKRLLLEDPGRSMPYSLHRLLPRLNHASRQDLALSGVARGSALHGFSELLALAGGPLPEQVTAVVFVASPHWRQINDLLAEFRKPDFSGDIPVLADELWAIANLASSAVAEQLISHLQEQGVPSSNPMLEPLRFNALLPNHH